MLRKIAFGQVIDKPAATVAVGLSLKLNQRLFHLQYIEGRLLGMTSSDHDHIVIIGARENNLKNVSLRIPKRKITIFNG